MAGAQTTAKLIKASQKAYSQKWAFLVVFLLVLLVVVRVCVVTGFIPDATSSDSSATATSTLSVTNQTLNNSALAAYVPGANTSASVAASTGSAAPVGGSLNMNGDLPTKVVIPEINVSAVVANPATTDVNTLDNYLSYGAARYPTSATLDQQGNVILFGHSSYLPVIINQHYKTFDGIQNLKAGDLITVYSKTRVYTYSVTSEAQQSETTDSIPLTTTGHTLTLATCDSFGKKTDRFVVTATLVSSSPLGN
jgi:LPXTG-site transpeptidase (sortase) family protein